MNGGGDIPRTGAAARRRSFAWLGEMGLMFAAILAADFALRPAVELLNAAPHAFWIPVVAVALGHGTAGGLTTAAVATCLGWWHGWPPVSGDVDFYGRMLHQWKEPVLWLAAAFVLGRLYENRARERKALARRTREAEAQRQAIADHAMELRRHIATLEEAIAAGPSVAGKTDPTLVPRADDLDAPRIEEPRLPQTANRSLLALAVNDGR